MPYPSFLRVAVIFLLALLTGGRAAAHPLGDFSINQYFIVDATGPRPALHFLLDVAEIPSFTELDMLDTNYDSVLAPEEVETYLDQRIPQLARFIRLRVNDRDVPLTVEQHKLVLLEGNGAMVVFNLLLRLESEAPWPDGPFTIHLTSENYPDEQGTRECLLLTGPDRLDTTRELPEADRGDQRPVEQSVIAAPVYGNRAAAFTLGLAPGANATPPPEADAARDFSWTSTARMAREMGESGVAHGLARALLDSGFRDGLTGDAKPLLDTGGATDQAALEAAPRGDRESTFGKLLDDLSAIIRRDEFPPPSVLAIGLLIAAALGMGHAFAPGHGKTVMAAYLIGERGTAWHAIMLGITVTIIHTWSVILLGVVTLFFKDTLSESQVNFWTGIASGVIIVVIGIMLFRQRYGEILARAAQKGGAWAFDHGHDHLPAGTLALDPGAAPSYRNILWLGVSGGIVPCPSALIVLLLAIKVGRLTYGLALILAFSLGLAAVLVAIGLLVVRASRLLGQRQVDRHPLLTLLPLASAALITVLGAWVVVWTLLQFDLLRF